MSKYTVTIDTSYAEKAYDKITVEADTAAKAKYKVSKISPCPFGTFISLFKPTAKKVSDDAPLWWLSYVEYNGEFKLMYVGKADIK